MILAIKSIMFQIKRKARSHVRRDRTEGTNTNSYLTNPLLTRTMPIEKKHGSFAEPPKTRGADPESIRRRFGVKMKANLYDYNFNLQSLAIENTRQKAPVGWTRSVHWDYPCYERL